MNTELFLFLCKKVKLNKDDMEDMTIGMCLDYMDYLTEINNTDRRSDKSRKATQSDFDSF